MDWVQILFVDLGQQLIPWVATFVLGILGKYVYSKIGNEYWRNVTSIATQEVFDAAQEIHQTYVKAIKKGRADGQLTGDEKKEASKLAIAAAKSNLGMKGFARLAKVMGGKSAATSYLASKVESSVNAMKVVEKATDAVKKL